jgi:iron complex transport system substrate-binding protein
LTGCSKPDLSRESSPQTSTDFPPSPQRIISLSPAITEELYLLQADNLLVADTYYCKRPADAKNKIKVGSLRDFDLERIVALKPDLVLCTNLVNMRKTAKLKQLGIRVIELAPPKSFDEICRNFIALGKIINRASPAEKIVAKARSEVDSIRKQVEHLPTKKVFMQIGAKPLVTVSRDYFINDYIRYAGGSNISGQAISNLYSRESVLLNNPDVILIANMGITSDEEKKAWEKYPTLTAVKNAEIHVVESDTFCNPTISAFMDSLRITLSLLHPRLKSAMTQPAPMTY